MLAFKRLVFASLCTVIAIGMTAQEGLFPGGAIPGGATPGGAIPGITLPRDTLFDGREIYLKPLRVKGRKTLDSLSYFSFDTLSGLWTPTNSYLYHYDQAGRLHEWIHRTWATNRWLNQLLTRDYYDDGFVTLRDQLTWNTNISAWQYYRQTSYLRDLSGNVTVTTNRQWNQPEQEWDNLTRRLMEYDDEGNRTLLVHQLATDTGWINSYRFLYLYSLNLLTDFFNQDWTEGENTWQNREWVHYSYNTEGQPAEDLNHTWNSTTGWMKQTRVLYLRQAGGEVAEKLYQTWDAVHEAWKDAVSYLYFQDKTGLDTLVIYRVINSSGTGWRELKKYSYSYDREGSLLGELWSEYDSKRFLWYDVLKACYYYSGTQEALQVDIIDSTEVSCYGFSDGSGTAMATGGTPPYLYSWNDENTTASPTVTGLSPDRFYVVRVTDALLNTATDSIRLTEPPAVVTGPVSGPLVCGEDQVSEHSVEMAPGSVFAWEVEGGTITEGQGTAVVRVRWKQKGSLCVTETDEKGCEGETSCIQVEVTPSGVPGMKPGTIPHLFPNPVQAGMALTAECGGLLFQKILITDLSGKVLHQWNKVSGTFRMEETENLAPGVYLLHFIGDYPVALRLVVQ